MIAGMNEFGRTIAVCRQALIPVAIFSFFLNLLMLTLPLYAMQVFDRVVSGQSTETLLYLTVIAIFSLVVLALLDLLRARVLVRLGTWLDQRLSPSTFAEAIKVSLRSRRSHTRPMRDLQELRNFMSSNTLFSIFDIPWLPVYVVVIWILHPAMGMLATAVSVGFLLLALVNELVTRTPLNTAQEQQTRAQGDAESIMRNAEVVNALGMGANAVARWLGSYRAVVALGQIASDRGRVVLSLAKWLRMSVQVAVMGMGAYLVMRQELAPGGMIASSILLGRALAPIEGAIDTWKTATSARRAYQRLRAFFAEMGSGLTVDRTRLPAPQGRFSVRNLHFGYPGLKAPTVQNVSFDVEPGEVLAIVGPSGAGKSTLARLLTGIYVPRHGTVRLDGADVSRWDRGEVGPYLGYLPQDVELFAGTVAENIARLGPAPEGTVVEAARLAGAHEMILRLPNGYDTESGEAGSQLSGGQRQRVGLARALFGDPSVIILDEPNANLDDEGEAALQRAIAAVKARGGTVVMIAHRPSMLEQADRILVLRDGRVHAVGERTEILKQITRPKPVAVPLNAGAKSPPRVAAG